MDGGGKEKEKCVSTILFGKFVVFCCLGCVVQCMCMIGDNKRYRPELVWREGKIEERAQISVMHALRKRTLFWA